MKRYIIVDLHTKKALYGTGGITMTFSTSEIAEEVAIHFYKSKDDYIIAEICYVSSLT